MTLPPKTANPCIIILGGSFDPVHSGHVKLAQLFVDLLKPTQLRIIPTGRSSQKAPCRATPEQRIAMLSLAFAKLAESTLLYLDTQEIKRAEQELPSYSVETLTLLRNEFGPSASLLFLIGSDQLQQLHLWKNWQHLFELAHIVVATRPGFSVAATGAINDLVLKEFQRRSCSTQQLQQLREQPCGFTYIYTDLCIDVSSTQIRDGKNLSLVPPNVLNYIQQHHIY